MSPSPLSRVARLTALALGLVLPACGSHNVFSGAVDGRRLTVKSAAFGLLTGSLGDVPGLHGSGPVALVVLSDSPSVCADAGAAALAHGHTYFAISLARIDLIGQSLIAPAAGDYVAVAGLGTSANDSSAIAAAVAAGGIADGYFYAGDTQCINVLPQASSGVSSGTVSVGTLVGSAGGSARGTFELKMGSQNSAVSGSFSAPYCAALAQLSAPLLQSTAPPCR